MELQEAPTLSPELRRTTAILEVPNAAAPGGTTRVYVLAVSHVSARSCDDIRELISTVRPEVVLLELCKDRLGLLVGDYKREGRQPVWHCPDIKLVGLPEGKGYPSADGLKSLLTCQPGTPVSALDIEGDVVRLQATGLFKSVTPSVRSGTNSSAPLFVVEGAPAADDDEDADDVVVSTVPPLDVIEFRVEQRVLPEIASFTCRVDSSVLPLGVSLSPEQLAEVVASVNDEVRTGTATVTALMRASAQLKDMAASPAPLEVIFYGADTGKVEAVLHASRGNSDAVSGLEPSAVDGEGVGITPFVNPNRASDVKVGLTSRLPQAVVERIARSRQVTANLASDDGVDGVDGTADASSRPVPEEAATVLRAAAKRTSWREWSWKERATAADEDPEPQPLKDALAGALTSTYTRFQNKAADKTGVDAGEAWRVALEAGVQAGASQIILGDRPALVTQRRLAQGVWNAVLPRVTAGIVALNLTVLAGSVGTIEPTAAYAALGATVAGTALSLVPLFAPFVEAWRFGEMAAEEIEAAVAVDEPIQSNLDRPMKLFGEDALLDWPGAAESVIAERDAYMARALAAAALGSNGQAPGFVVDVVDGHFVLRYMAAEGAPNRAAPIGCGDGVYRPLEGASAVVAVVGSAHVRGICRLWPEAPRQLDVSDLLRS